MDHQLDTLLNVAAKNIGNFILPQRGAIYFKYFLAPKFKFNLLFCTKSELPTLCTTNKIH